MANHPFITVTSTVSEVDSIVTNKVNNIYIIGTKGSGSIGDNEIRLINNITEFDSIIGSNAPSRASYNFLRGLDGSVPVYFVNGTSTNATPTTSDHIQAGILEIGKNVRLEPGILLIPETSGLTTELQTVFNAAQNLVSNTLLNWEFYHNLSLDADTKDKALAEVTNLSSPQGHSSVFWGYGKDANGNDIPLSVVAAARTTYLNRTRNGYFSPSAFQETIPFASVDRKYLPEWYVGVNEYEEMKTARINTLFRDGDGITNSTYTICGAWTLSSANAWRFINTRYAANNLFYRAARVLRTFLFLPVDIAKAVDTPAATRSDEFNNADVILALELLLSAMRTEGAFSNPPPLDDGTIPRSYNILPRRLNDGSLSITLEAYLVETRDKISLSFVKKG